MKAGDRVVCKKDLGDSTYLPELLFFKKGDIYKISECHKHGIYSIRAILFGFYFTTYLQVNGYYCFDDYFIALKESRKLKLEKINELK